MTWTARTLDRIGARWPHLSPPDRPRMTADEMESEACSRIARGGDRVAWERHQQAGDLVRISWATRNRIAGITGFGAAGERDPEPVQFARFLGVRREPAAARAEYARTCAELAGHLAALADECDALDGDDECRGRWRPRLPERGAVMARRRAQVWRELATVANPDLLRRPVNG